MLLSAAAIWLFWRDAGQSMSGSAAPMPAMLSSFYDEVCACVCVLLMLSHTRAIIVITVSSSDRAYIISSLSGRGVSSVYVWLMFMLENLYVAINELKRMRARVCVWGLATESNPAQQYRVVVSRWYNFDLNVGRII